MNFIDELTWRGLIQDIMPGTKELLDKEKIAGYIGFDPTSDSLHIGSLIPIIILKHFQLAGHTPIALVGGATGMVGDPSGKSEERNLLDEETLAFNLKGIQKQLEKFIDFSNNIRNKAAIVNNYDWFKGYDFLHFIRDIGKYISVNYMMSKDSVKKRLENETGMSFTEFSYQLVQGYDFYWLYNHKNCKLQMGGSDQWGNITTGAALIHKKCGGEAFALTCPLITKADGGKFGKTEKGNIWLDANKTTPYQFYQFWLNSSDEDAIQWIKKFTFLDKITIESLIDAHLLKKEDRILQKKLAEETTIFVHGEEALKSAIQTAAILFGNDTYDILQKVTESQLLQAFEGVPTYYIPAQQVTLPYSLIDLLVEASIFPSKGEARKMIQSGGVSINKHKIGEDKKTIEKTDFLKEKILIIQKGKKNYFLIIIN
ncbi:MAG: tyrosine--tRNA ligase [Sediminibacterium sp.]|nr:tyrosine--tRNA ligase [Sediminibacterium sp.]